MKHIQEYVIELGYWGATLFGLLLSAGFFAVLFGALSPQALSATLWGAVLFYIFGALSLFLAVYFLTLILRVRSRRRRIERETPRGRIQISPFAIQDFISALLVREAIPKFKVHLGRAAASNGIEVRLRVTLPLRQNVMETAEHLQELIRSEIEGRIGIRVDKVEVFAQSLSLEAAERRLEPVRSIELPGDERE